VPGLVSESQSHLGKHPRRSSSCSSLKPAASPELLGSSSCSSASFACDSSSSGRGLAGKCFFFFRVAARDN